MRKHSYTLGQSLTEYAIIGSLVLAVAIPALMSLSKFIKDGFGNIMQGEVASPNVSGPIASANINPSTSLDSNLATGNIQNRITSNSSASTAEASNAAPPIQVTGANGTYIAEQGQEILKIAAQYQQNSPEVANLLVQLGNQGIQVGVAVGDLESGKTSGAGNVSPTSIKFDRLWDSVQGSQVFKSLSPADQQLVSQLSQEIMTNTNDYMNNGGPLGNASGKITQNGTAIKQCGENGSC